MTKFPALKNDLILRAARGEKVERPPVWMMRQAGRYLPEYHVVKGKRDFFETCRDPKIAAEITIQPIEHFPGLIDVAIIFNDILVIPQALGMTVEMVDKVGPHFPEPLRTPEDIKRLKKSSEVVIKDCLGWSLDAITLTRHQLDGRVPLFGFVGAPFTLLAYMLEGGSSRMHKWTKEWLYKYPEECHEVLQRITDVAVDYLAHQVIAGAQLLQVFESTGGELTPAEFKLYSLPYVKQIRDKVPARVKELAGDAYDPKEHDVPMVFFPRNSWYALDACCDLGYDVISLDSSWDPAEAVKVVGDRRVTLQGNLDPGVIYGSREMITKKVEEMIAGFGGGKQNYIINFGHGTQPMMDPEQVGWFLEECHRVGKQ